jgi:hypothetical protein
VAVSREQRNIQIRIEQEKVAAMLESIVTSAKGIDYRILDELNSSADSEQLAVLKGYLSSLEALAHHWELISTQKYAHRLSDYGILDIYINQLPRSNQEGKLFCGRTFILSCHTPYMELKNSDKIFIGKEYSNAAGKLHLSFYTLHDLVSRALTEKIESINRQATAEEQEHGGVIAFFKTIFSSDVHQLHEA